MTTTVNNNGVTGEEMTAIRETLVACLNEWQARLKDKMLSSEERSKLFMNCIDDVRLLLLSYGPAPPDANKEFIKLLLFMRHMQEKPAPNIPATANNAAHEVDNLPRDGKAGDLALKKQTTMNDYLTRDRKGII